MFSCVWLHFKKCFGKYFLVFGCVLENTIENTFSTCYSHFLTFSRLSNEYIISFIPQYRNINKTQKKNHQIWSHFLSCQTTETQTNTETKIFQSNTETQTFSGFDEGLQSCEAPRRLRSARRQDRDRHGASRDRDQWFARLQSTLCAITIDAKARSRSARCFAQSWQTISAIEALDDLGELGFPCGAIEALDGLSIFVAELFLSLALSLFYAWKETV